MPLCSTSPPDHQRSQNRQAVLKLTKYILPAARVLVIVSGLIGLLLGAPTEGVSQQERGFAQARPEPGYLGIVADDRGSQSGIQVLQVIPQGPAEKGGLRAGDLMLAVNNQAVRRLQDLGSVLQKSQRGDVLQFDVNRNGKTQRLLVVLGRRPQQVPARPSGTPDEVRADQPSSRVVEGDLDLRRGLLGVRVISISQEACRRLSLPSTLGALVTDVVVESVADAAGLQPDDAIVAINSLVVNRPSDLAAVVSRLGPGQKITVSFYRAGRFRQLEAVLGVPQPPAPVDLARPNQALDVPPPPGAIDGQPQFPFNRDNQQGPQKALRLPQNNAADLPRVPAGNEGVLAARVQQLEGVIDRLLNRIDELEDRLNDPQGEQVVGPPLPGSPDLPGGPDLRAPRPLELPSAAESPNKRTDPAQDKPNKTGPLPQPIEETFP